MVGMFQVYKFTLNVMNDKILKIGSIFDAVAKRFEC